MLDLFQKIRPIFKDLLINKLSSTYKSLVILTGLIVLQGISVVGLTGCGSRTLIYETGAAAEDADTVDSGDSVPDGHPEPVTEEVTGESEDKMLIVHLCGAVNNPGVYELDIDSRVIDGIREAGGFREDASEDTLNLAMELKDGSRVYVPTIDEVNEDNAGKGATAPYDYITMADNAPGQSIEGDTKININTADIALLTNLPGIGETRAKSIIAYRESKGGFNSIEEIKNVSGIGDSSFEKLKDDITVD